MLSTYEHRSTDLADIPMIFSPWRIDDQLLVDGAVALNDLVAGQIDVRVERGLFRLLRRWEVRTGLTFARTATGELSRETAPPRTGTR